jgi:phage replication-related protein YjqB (UPF0714/DUF867 family)
MNFTKLSIIILIIVAIIFLVKTSFIEKELLSNNDIIIEESMDQVPAGAVPNSDIVPDMSKSNLIYGVDYLIDKIATESKAIIIAIHGGRIEKGTSELAKEISTQGQYNYYSFVGIKKADNSKLHLTSVEFNEETALAMVSKSSTTISIHGCTGTEKVTYLGGLDNILGKQIQKNLEAAGFIVKPAPKGLAGKEKLNITNRNLSGKGVQIELSRGLRDSFYNADGKTNEELIKYAKAINEAIQANNLISIQP